MAKSTSKVANQTTVRDAAANVAKRLKVTKVFANTKGEFFTSENLAILSEKGNKDNVSTYDFPKEVASGKEPASAEKVSEEV